MFHVVSSRKDAGALRVAARAVPIQISALKWRK